MSEARWVEFGHERKAILRSITMSDVDERHRFFVELSMAQTGMVHTIDEIEIHNHETKDKIHDFLVHKRGLWLVAETQDNKIIGEVDILVKDLWRVNHNGVLSIGILPEFQGQGLGGLLMSHALAWAKRLPLLRIELAVFANNGRALDLYRKFGFVMEGRRKNFLRNSDGSFQDDLLMAAYLV